MPVASVTYSNPSVLCLLTHVLFFLSVQLSHAQTMDRFSQFDWELSKSVGEGLKENVLISPISIKTVLAMLYQGAQGNTSRQLETALGLQKYERTMSTIQLSNLLHTLQQESPDYELDIGTKLFLDMKTQLNEHFNTTLTRVFNASLEKVDFSKPEVAVKIINDWAASVTRGHIQELMSEADAKASIVLLLLNAIYFKGQWLQPFPINQTVKDKFKINNIKTVVAEFMNCVQTQKYAEADDLDSTFIRLPYMGDRFSMYIILPNSNNGLDYLLQKITPDRLKEVIKNMEEVEINVSIPKFHFDFSTSLRPALEKMGLHDIFSDKADLSGISKEKTDNLMVSDVIQKAGIKVNEQGSTAYVTTQVDLVSKFGDHVTTFRADRPFLFFIKDDKSDIVIFVGKVVNPMLSGQVTPERREPNTNDKPVVSQPAYHNVNQPPVIPLQNKPVESETQQPNSNNVNTEETKIPGGSQQSSRPTGSEQSWQSSHGIIEQTSNIGATSGQPMEETRPNPPNPNGFKPPESGYFNDNGEYIKQNFDQEKFTFFDTSLLQELSKSEPSNWVVSTASVKTVLGMIYEGAATETELDLSRILRLPRNKTRGLRMLHSIQRELHSPVGPQVKWVMANRLLVSAKLPTLPEYNQAMRSMYHASVDLAKFETPDQTAADINQWINNMTQGFIPVLVNPESIDKDSQMVLLNAVYFKGDWQFPFNKKYTQHQCFFPEPNKCKQVNMMTQRVFIKYGFHKQLLSHVFELPYADPRFSMVFLVPANDGGLEDVLINLPFCPLLPFLNEIKPEEVQLSLPSFKIEFSKDLTSTIAKMGSGSMFSDNADLRNMLGPRKGKISKILHKAKIIVNEKGTEAGAGTAGVIVPLMNSELVQITVNQPFLFYIRDQRSGFLFVGKIFDPSPK